MIQSFRVLLMMCLIAGAGARLAAQTTVAELAHSGWQAIKTGDADRAVSAFREALTRRPGDAVLHLGAGAAAHLQGRDNDAQTSLKQALRLDPRLTPASTLLGEIAYHHGDLDLAIKTYERALAQEPGNRELADRLATWRGEASVHRGFEEIRDDRFAIMFEGPVVQPLAARAVRVLGDSFWRIGKALGAYPSDPIPVVLYTERQFRDVTGAPEWAGGGFDGQIRLPVRGAAQNLEAFDRVLTHELVHAMIKSIARRNVPAWLHEGLAMYFEGRDAAAAERDLAAARVFVPLTALETSFSRLDALQATVAYDESAAATRALLGRIGMTGIAQLLQDLDGGQTIEQAVERFGFTFREFEAGFAQRLRGATRPTSNR